MKKLITHDGSFHSDDIFAAATISIYLEKAGEEYEIIRTRDKEKIDNGDYVFDVGGEYDPEMNRFDHHQKGGAGTHSNGIEYASFGLVWKKFGEEVSGSPKVADIIENKLVSPIDAGDNGFSLAEKKYDISPIFIQDLFYLIHPTWKEGNAKNDEYFLKAVEIAKEILSRSVVHGNDFVTAEEKITSIYKNTEDKRIIILDKNYPVEGILNNFPEPLFVIYPRESDGFWSVKAVRENKNFKNKKDFPKTWAGLRDEELQKVTGVPDAIFCHRGLFLAVAKSKEGAIKLAQIAIES